eukprot:gene4113-biopygen2576
MRESNPNVHVMEVAKKCDITEVSKKTLCRVFTTSGYQYIRPRRKGLLTLKDKKKRVAYALKALKDTSPTYWTEDVLLYLDAVSFVHKSNPYEDALSPAGRVWRKPGEGLEITAKGSKDLPGGRENDPSQNSAMARDAMKNIGAEVVNIPPRDMKERLDSLQNR